MSLDFPFLIALCKNLLKTLTNDIVYMRLLVRSIGYSGTTRFIQMMSMGCPFPGKDFDINSYVKMVYPMK